MMEKDFRATGLALAIMSALPDNAASSAAAAAASAAEAKAVQESIPEDYTTLSNDVDDLKSAVRQNETHIIAVESGTFSDNDGAQKTVNVKRLRNVTQIPVCDLYSITLPDGYSGWFFRLDKNGEHISAYNGWLSGTVDLPSVITAETEFVNIAIGKTASPNDDISADAATVESGISTVYTSVVECEALKSALTTNFSANGFPTNVEKFALVNSQITDAASNGVTVTQTGPNKIKLNGTSTSAFNLNLDFKAYELSSTMYFNMLRSDGLTSESGSYLNIGYFKSDDTVANGDNIEAFNTWVKVDFASAAKKSRNFFHVPSGASYSNVEFELVALRQEPYNTGINQKFDLLEDRYDNCIKKYSITTTGEQSIYVHTGDKVVFEVTSNTVATNTFVRPYLSGDPIVSLSVGSGRYTLTATKDGFIGLQNTATVISAKAYIDTRFDDSIANLASQIVSGGEVYTIKKDGSGDYSSFTACLKALENDSNPKTIYIFDGEYDIFDEKGGTEYLATISDPGNTSWRSVNEVVPPNTKLIGCGNVTLKYTPTAEQIGSQAMAALFSPLNVSGSCEIENIFIEAKNCRYAIHDESSGLSQYDDTVHKYRNVYAHKEIGTYGYNPTFASGLGARCKWNFENCVFKNDIGVCWTVHTTNSVAQDMATINFDNCVFVKDDGTATTGIMQFITGGGAHLATKNMVYMNNCYVNGKIALNGDTGLTQKYALTLVGCYTTGIDVDEDFTSNPYTPEVYMPRT